MLKLLLVLCSMQLSLNNGQGCQNQHQILAIVRQMKKLLSSQEASFHQSLHNMKKQLTTLQSSFQKQTSVNSEMCPQLAAPLHGKKLGKKVNIGHEVHFLCDPGFQLVGSETRVCQRNHTWSGQQPFCKNEVTPSNSSFSHPPRCTNDQGSYHCLCDTGFRIKSGICQDINECELFQSSSRQVRICTYECINTPGSYQCSCPQGYILNHEKNSCEDTDECSINKHNCSHRENCVNVYGGFRCVQPECPKTRLNTSYVKTSLFVNEIHVPWIAKPAAMQLIPSPFIIYPFIPTAPSPRFFSPCLPPSIWETTCALSSLGAEIMMFLLSSGLIGRLVN
uniref:Fibulin-7 isoform X2 n=1 Tax=Geotrypetes seraphini TaxID=260995 RepID=A0A6P8RBS3_GEOSA|nr:fibulin-7 isoform X2 [Geotrypetes seraphini]